MPAAYTTERSQRAYEAAQEVIPGGVNSGARGPQAGWVPGPPMVARGQGSHLWDLDGNEYVDHLLALGPLIHGHSHPEVVDAVSRAIREVGTMFALPYELETEAAARVVAAVPSVELVRFGNSGTEVVLHATRLARAWTGRDIVIRFEGQYHGWADQLEWSHHPDLAAAGPRERPNAIPGSPGIPEVIGQTLLVLPWNDAEVVERVVAEQGDRIAAILTEPIMGNTGVIPPQPGYLEALRRLATDNGIVLIFDEVITGFRVALGGAQALYGVTPDLTTMAKALGGGFPVAAIGGRRDIMDQVSDGHVLHAGTYNANSVAVAAAIASLDVLGAARHLRHASSAARSASWPGCGASSRRPASRCRSRASDRCSSSGSARRRSSTTAMRRATSTRRPTRPWHERCTSAASWSTRATSSSGSCRPPTRKPISTTRSTPSRTPSRRPGRPAIGPARLTWRSAATSSRRCSARSSRSTRATRGSSRARPARAAVAAFLAERLAGTGAAISVDEVEPGRPNVVARWPGAGGGRSLCLNAHIDTVGHAGWPERALVSRIEGDRAIGLGAADDKGHVAVSVLVLESLVRSGVRLRGDLLVALTMDEEATSLGTQDLVRRHRTDAAIVVEPFGLGRGLVTHQGFGWLDIVVHGRAAHGSAPEEGIDAISHAAMLLRRLDALGAAWAAEPHPLNGATVYHASTIAGGSDYATYPASCTIGIEIGTQPGETIADRVREIEAICASIRSEVPDFDAEVSVRLDRDPFEAAGHEDLWAAAAEATRAVTGEDSPRGRRERLDGRRAHAGGRHPDDQPRRVGRQPACARRVGLARRARRARRDPGCDGAHVVRRRG